MLDIAKYTSHCGEPSCQLIILGCFFIFTGKQNFPFTLLILALFKCWDLGVVCSAQPVQDNHYVKWHVRLSCLSFPSALHMAARHSSHRPSGFSTSQGSAGWMCQGVQSLLLVSAVTTCTPLCSAATVQRFSASLWYQSCLTDLTPVICRQIPTGVLSSCSQVFA